MIRILWNMRRIWLRRNQRVLVRRRPKGGRNWERIWERFANRDQFSASRWVISSVRPVEAHILVDSLIDPHTSTTIGYYGLSIARYMTIVAS